MNKIAIALNVIGVLAIIGGIIIGFATYSMPLEGYYTLTEEDYSVLFTWIGAGLISGIMMFGFAEIINLLDKIKNKLGNETEEPKIEKEPSEADKYMENILNK